MTATTPPRGRAGGKGANVFWWLSSKPLAGVLVLAAGLAVTLLLWRLEYGDVEQHRQQRFERTAERVSERLRQRLLVYEEVMQGASGLFAAVPQVSVDHWRAYFGQLGFDTELRGAQLMGFAGIDAGGQPRLTMVYPETPENLRALGYQPGDDASQRAALERARNTGRVALSERGTLPVEAQLRVQPGFVLYLPVYRHDARGKSDGDLSGYLLGALRVHDLLQELRLELETDAVIDLYDGIPAPGSLLFTSRGPAIPALSHDETISFGGRAWTLRTGSSPGFEAQWSDRRPRLVLLGGSAISLGLALLVVLGARYQREFVAVHRDLEEGHARYLSLVNSVPGTVFRVGHSLPWRLDYISDGIGELTGRIPSQWLDGGDFLKELVHPDDLPRVLRVVSWATTRGTPFELEHRLKGEAEEPRWVHQRVRSMRDAGGNVLGMNGVLTDVTHTRQLMDTLARQRETLEEQVAARTVELLLARDKAEAASTAKSRFLSTMSHELRTPMNAVIGFATLLANTEKDESRRRQLQQIQNSAGNLLELLNRVIDFSRADAGTLNLMPAPFAVADILSAAAQRLRTGVARRAITYCVDATGDIPAQAVGDARRIQEVLLELVDNALEYTESGSIRVELRAEHRSEGTIELGFTVQDTGCGISTTDANLLFGAFQQADASSTRKHGGIGLGLALARRLVMLMGGSIGVEPVSEGGSRFWFTVRVQAAGDSTERLRWLPARPDEQGLEPAGLPAVPELAPGEKQAIQNACGEISRLLRNGELRVREVLQAHAPLLQAVFPSQVPHITGAVEKYDFDTALRVLEGGCREVGLDLGE